MLLEHERKLFLRFVQAPLYREIHTTWLAIELSEMQYLQLKQNIKVEIEKFSKS